MSLNKKPCFARSNLIDLNPDEITQRMSHYTFMINLDWCNGSCNTLDDLSIRIFVSNKTLDVVFNVLKCEVKNSYQKLNNEQRKKLYLYENPYCWFGNCISWIFRHTGYCGNKFQ